MNILTKKPMDYRYIKLGSAGTWAENCIEVDQTIRLNYLSPHHELCLEGDWGPVEEYWFGRRNGRRGATTNDIRQIKDFYQCPPTTLWFTFFNEYLWWCFAERTVTRLDDGTRVRKATGGWKNTDLSGNILIRNDLDTSLAKLFFYRGTICGLQPEVQKYLSARIGWKEP